MTFFPSCHVFSLFMVTILFISLIIANFACENRDDMIDFPLKAALFDLDGVVVDTEAQYSIFWGGVCREYHPEKPGLENRIKGQTLDQIFEAHFESKEARADIVNRLNAFEAQMNYAYIKGIDRFMEWLKGHGVSTALVTSSNVPKMNCVYRSHPEFKQWFDIVLTSEDFTQSKPHPQCYLLAASKLGVEPGQCMVYEDSFNGLKAGRAAGMPVMGLSTTNHADDIAPFCDVVVEDFTNVDEETCRMTFDRFRRRP